MGILGGKPFNLSGPVTQNPVCWVHLVASTVFVSKLWTAKLKVEQKIGLLALKSSLCGIRLIAATDAGKQTNSVRFFSNFVDKQNFILTKLYVFRTLFFKITKACL